MNYFRNKFFLKEILHSEVLKPIRILFLYPNGESQKNDHPIQFLYEIVVLRASKK